MSDTVSIEELVRGIAARRGDPVVGDVAPRRPEAPLAVQHEHHRTAQLHASVEAIPAEHRAARLKGAGLDVVWDREAVKETRAAHLAPTTITTFVGPSRSGKSTLATALYVAKLAAAKWPAGFWAKASAILLEELREHGRDDETPSLGRARRTPLLLLDDLGNEPDTGDARSIVVDLIDARHSRQLPTIVTTGLDLAEVLRRYGSGLRERLTEPKRTTVVHVRKDPNGPR